MPDDRFHDLRIWARGDLADAEAVLRGLQLAGQHLFVVDGQRQDLGGLDDADKGARVVTAIETLQAWVTRLVRLVMKLTPYGVLALMANGEV